MKILITGGTGYIGSHTAVELQQAGHDIFLFDNLSNSSSAIINRLNSITGCPFNFFLGDIRNKRDITNAIQTFGIEAVIHCAGLKAVGESVKFPIDYYDNNVRGSLNLIDAMSASQIKTLVFSSSATVYGDPVYLPIDELHPTAPTNPYGRTKLIVEQILADVTRSDPEWRVAVLRYFNPVGAHKSGLIGENPSKTPNNLMPFISQVASGQLKELSIFGNDYDTPDGTGVRDYIHVTDLARGHLAALNSISHNTDGALKIWNLGTGRGYSVLELLDTFERTNRIAISRRISARRPGDIGTCYANTTKAEFELGWKAVLGIEEMCQTTWNFQKMWTKF